MSAKRYRAKKAKPNSLRVSFGKIDGLLDICYAWNGVDKPDARLLDGVIGCKRFGFNGYLDTKDSLLVELINRGYDIRTLDFKIEKLSTDDKEGQKINKMMLQTLGDR